MQVKSITAMVLGTLVATNAWAASSYKLVRVEVDGAPGAAAAENRCTVTADQLEKSVTMFNSTTTSTTDLSIDGSLQNLIAPADGAKLPDLSNAQSFHNFFLITADGGSKLLRSEVFNSDGNEVDVEAQSPESHQLVRYLNRVCTNAL